MIPHMGSLHSLSKSICPDTARAPMPAVSQLQPFNEHRFDSAIALLSQKHGRPVSKYEAVKLHMLADVFHTLTTGTPIIGGTLQPWPNGPVIEEAYERLDDWCTRFDYMGEMPDGFEITACKNLRFLSPTFSPDAGDFSASELESLNRAWSLFIPMMDDGYNGYMKSQEFFHSDETFIGRAYNRAKQAGRDIDWNDIIDAYDALHGTDHEHIKALIQF
jgi:hypothetical protein